MHEPTVLTDAMLKKIFISSNFRDLIEPLLQALSQSVHKPVANITLLEAIPAADSYPNMMVNVLEGADSAPHTYMLIATATGADHDKYCTALYGSGYKWYRLNDPTGIAADVALADALDIYAATNVEDALAEAGVNVPMLKTQVAHAVSGTLAVDEVFAKVTNTAAPRTIKLPTAALGTGKIYYIKDTSGGAGTNAITVEGEAGELIDGGASYIIDDNYGWCLVADLGTAWAVLASQKTQAADVSIADVLAIYAATTVEAALAEVGVNVPMAQTVVAHGADALLAVDEVVALSTLAANPRTFNLPTAAAGGGKVYYIADQSGNCGTANPLVVATEGAELINGAASVSLTEPYGFLVVASYSGNWYVLARNRLPGASADASNNATFPGTVDCTGLKVGTVAINSTPLEIDQTCDLSYNGVRRQSRKVNVLVPNPYVGGTKTLTSLVLPAKCRIRDVWLDILTAGTGGPGVDKVDIGVGVGAASADFIAVGDLSATGVIDGPIGAPAYPNDSCGGLTVSWTASAATAADAEFNIFVVYDEYL